MVAENKLFVELRILFVELFHIQPGDLNMESQFGELPQWDSMGHMDLMVALEDRYGIEISAETISQLTSIPAIMAHIEARQHA